MENKKLIARRIKGKGDTWEEITGLKDEKQHTSLTDMLEYYVTKTGYVGDYLLCPLKGEIYIIENIPNIVKDKKFNLYGDY